MDLTRCLCDMTWVAKKTKCSADILQTFLANVHIERALASPVHFVALCVLLQANPNSHPGGHCPCGPLPFHCPNERTRTAIACHLEPSWREGAKAKQLRLQSQPTSHAMPCFEALRMVCRTWPAFHGQVPPRLAQSVQQLQFINKTSRQSHIYS